MLLHTLFPTHREETVHSDLRFDSVWLFIYFYVFLCTNSAEQWRDLGTHLPLSRTIKTMPFVPAIFIGFHYQLLLVFSKNQCKGFNINYLLIKLLAGKEIRLLSLWCMLTCQNRRGSFQRMPKAVTQASGR